MADSFPRRAKFVVLCSPHRGQRVAVTIPTWAYRVTAPIIPRRGLDLFQRVVLSLCAAGVHTADRLHEMTQLHPRLCAYILDRSRHDGLLNAAGEPSERGRAALRTGAIDEDTEWAVRYVFYDPLTSQFWPRTADRLDDAYVVNVSRDHVVIELGTAGGPDKVKALRMPGADGVNQPRSEQVLEIVRRDRQARLDSQRQAFERTHNLGPIEDGFGARVAPESQSHELSRVWVSTDPEPVELLGFIGTATIRGEGEWRAHDPFGVGMNDMFDQLIALWASQHEELGQRLGQLGEEQSAAVKTNQKEASKQARTQAEAELINKFGGELRTQRRVLNKLIELRVASYDDEYDGSVATAKRAAFALYEELFHRMAMAYPLPRRLAESFAAEARQRRQNRTSSRPSGVLAAEARQRREDGTSSWPSGVLKETMIDTAKKIGVFKIPYTILNVGATELGQMAEHATPPEFTKFGTLVASCLLTAHRSPEHPLRKMVERHPDLLDDLDLLRSERNPQSHRLGRPSVPEDLRWCMELADLATTALLDLSRPVR